MFRNFLRIAFLFLFPSFVFAYTNPGPPAGFINDFAKILSPAVIQSLEQELANFEKQTKHEIAVVTIPSLQNDTIENFAVKLFEDWKIGKKAAGNGVLFLIAKDDRKMRIEVGYGLEGALTDAQALAIINKIARPAFQANDFNQGVAASVRAIEGSIQGEDISGRLAVAENKETPRGLFNLLIYGFFAVIFFGNFLIHLFSQSKKWWPGGIWGAILGAVLGYWLFGLALSAIGTILGLGFFGLLTDYWASKHGPFKNKLSGRGGPFFWGGFGGRGGGGGGFGGFGGGGSGGGGSSGGW